MMIPVQATTFVKMDPAQERHTLATMGIRVVRTTASAMVHVRILRTYLFVMTEIPARLLTPASSFPAVVLPIPVMTEVNVPTIFAMETEPAITTPSVVTTPMHAPQTRVMRQQDAQTTPSVATTPMHAQRILVIPRRAV